MQTNQNYTDICSSCGSPARTETGSRDGLDWEEWQVCINSQCHQFDQWIPRQRKMAEEAVRQTSAYRRKTVWLPEIRRHARQQRKLRAAIGKI